MPTSAAGSATTRAPSTWTRRWSRSGSSRPTTWRMACRRRSPTSPTTTARGATCDKRRSRGRVRRPNSTPRSGRAPIRRRSRRQRTRGCGPSATRGRLGRQSNGRRRWRTRFWKSTSCGRRGSSTERDASGAWWGGGRRGWCPKNTAHRRMHGACTGGAQRGRSSGVAVQLFGRPVLWCWAGARGRANRNTTTQRDGKGGASDWQRWRGRIGACDLGGGVCELSGIAFGGRPRACRLRALALARGGGANGAGRLEVAGG
mmetsp:Transcript_1251/g.3194  ORF Transcript_1251/g.3194 Transcript_1251/m.3194 type:complete len:259 (-) Transcript_1251:53-829(-)